RVLTGEQDARAAALALAARVPSVVVSLGRDGALSVEGSRLRHQRTRARGPVASTLGAGDLLAGAYVALALQGLGPAERLRAAVTYASLAVRAPTVLEGAATRAALDEELQEEDVA